jgi:hypothetical protein
MSSRFARLICIRFPEGIPVAFSSWLLFPLGGRGKLEMAHREPSSHSSQTKA